MPLPMSRPKASVTAPVAKCICAGNTVLGVGSTTVSGTGYTWCQSGGPPIYPTSTTAPTNNKPTANPVTTMAPSVPLASVSQTICFALNMIIRADSLCCQQQCIHVFTERPQHTATCTTSISKSNLSTPLPNLAWTCLSSGLFRRTCYCQTENRPQPCVPPKR